MFHDLTQPQCGGSRVTCLDGHTPVARKERVDDTGKAAVVKKDNGFVKYRLNGQRYPE
jgi:hypothetical protein